MSEPNFTAGLNLAMKVPLQDYEATVAFYRDILRFEVEEEAIDAPTVSRTHKVSFGPNTLWLDCVDNYSHAELWLELGTDDLDAATRAMADAGIHPCDEVEPLNEPELKSHWIKNQAGIVHLLAEQRRD
jgi:hypothetical protein